MDTAPSGEDAANADRFRMLFDSVPVGIYRTTPEGRMLDVNPALVRMLCYPTRDALLAEPVQSLYVDPEGRRAFLDAMEREGTVRNLEVRVRRRDGRFIWTRNSATAHRDAQGRTLWFDGVVEDVSVEKQTGAALQRRLAIEQTVASISARFVANTDLDTAIHETLADISLLSGASRAYLFLIHADGMENTHEWCAPGVTSQRDLLQNLPVDRFPWWMSQLRAGRAIHVKDVMALPDEASAERELLARQDIKSTLAFPVHVGERLAGFLGFDNVRRAETWRDDDLALLRLASRIMGDALQRREADEALQVSEERYRLLVEQSPLALQVFSPSGELIRVNRAWEKLWGCTLAQMRGWRWHDDPQLRQRGIASYAKRVLAGETVEMPPIAYVPRLGANAGREIWVRATMYPLKDDADDIREVVVLQEDVTQRRHAESELERSRQQLALSEKLSALGALVSGVAHEIRTPLTYINNNLFMLDRYAHRLIEEPAHPDEVAREVRQRTAVAVEGVERIEHLVDNLRGYAKLDTRRRSLAGLDVVVRGAIELFRATHRGQIHLEADLKPGPGILLDREQVQQVVLNLLTNAAEAMPTGGSIRVGTRPDGDDMVLEVEDDGPGIPAEALARVFEPFFSTKQEGTGLGLSISKRLVEAHGGVIRYERGRRGGARFVVVLPAPGSRA